MFHKKKFLATFCVLVAIGGPLYIAREHLPGVHLFISEAANECTASAVGLAEAKSVFKKECSGQRRADCDPINGRWVCSNKIISNASVKSQKTECFARGSSLNVAKKAFNSTCPGRVRVDCDPSGREWVCSTHAIGNAAPGTSNTQKSSVVTSTNANTQNSGSSKSGEGSNTSISSGSNGSVSGGAVATGGSGSIAQGSEGMIVLEAENTISALGDWKRSTAIGGYSGSGHITYEGGTTSGWTKEDGRNVSRPESPLVYTFTASDTGTYQLMMRMHRRNVPGHSDHSNDGFIRLEGDFSAPNGGASKSELLSDHKYYGGGTSWAWNGGAPLDIHPKKYPARYNLTKGKTYKLVLSGRSKGWSVDRIVFALSSVSDTVAQGGEASVTVTDQNVAITSPPPQGSNSEQSVGRYKKGDLVSLHYDYCPDPDDGQASPAGRAVMDRYGLSYIVVGGTCGYDILDRFDPKGRTVLDAAFGRGAWIDAMANRSSAIERAGARWAQTLSSGGSIHVAEGGQSDVTADILRWISKNKDGLDLKKVFVYQHSCCTSKAYNEISTRPANLSHVKKVATYVPVANGNAGGNGSANLNMASSSFVTKARNSSKYGAMWKVAFDYLPANCSPQKYRCKLDFSDTVEVLKIVGDTTTKDVNDFVDTYISGAKGTLTPPSNTTTSSDTSTSNSQTTTTSSSGTTSTSTQETSGVCAVRAATFNAAINAYENSCAGVSRSDCDPVNGYWICASQSITASVIALANGTATATGGSVITTKTSNTAINNPIPPLPANVTPARSWADSYSANGQCYCQTTYDHNIAGVGVSTPQGTKTVREVCEKIGSGPGVGSNPLYNDVQCGNGPANDAGDEDYCPGRVDQGRSGCTVRGPSWNLDQYFPDDSSSSQNANSVSVTGGCEVRSIADLQSCISKASQIDKITLQNDISCSGGDCCPGGKPLMKLNNVSGLMIEGNGNKILRTNQQRSCHMVDIDGGKNITFQNITLDDDARDPACNLEDKCSIMLDIRKANNIAFRNVTVANGKRYVIYTSQVNGFTFSDSELYNSGVLGLYVGHSSTPSTNVRIENSYFHDNATNGLALLGVAGSSPSANIVEGNLFERNHKYGRWPVAAKYGRGFTGGGQVYIAQANGVTFRNNTIKDGVCLNCFRTKRNKSGASGLELGLPGKASISNLLIEGNTIINNDANGIRANTDVPTDSSIVIKNNTITGNASGILVKNATISGNTVRTR